MWRKQVAATDPEYEEAKRCPRCGQYGEKVSTVPGPKRHILKVETFQCITAGCRWEGTPWLIQINRDGSLGHRTPQGEKQYVLPQWAKNIGMRTVDEMRDVNAHQERTRDIAELEER
jgi:hypothetical protein